VALRYLFQSNWDFLVGTTTGNACSK